MRNAYDAIRVFVLRARRSWPDGRHPEDQPGFRLDNGLAEKLDSVGGRAAPFRMAQSSDRWDCTIRGGLPRDSRESLLGHVQLARYADGGHV